MDVAKIKEFLKNEYGICNEAEFNVAVSKSSGINLGIFTMPFGKKSESTYQKIKEG